MGPALLGATLLAPINRTGVGTGNSPGNSASPTPAAEPPKVGTGTGTTPPTVCRYDALGISGDVKTVSLKLDAMNTVLNTIQTVQLAGIDNKLGPALPNGGLSGFLKRFWDSMGLTRILSILTFITTLHNAYMLSNALTQTLFSAFDNVLQIFNIQLKNSEGEAENTSQWVGAQIEGFFNSIFGTETVDGIQSAWKRWNRIYQAASNIIFSVQSITYSILESLEVVGHWVAWIGNAARKFGVVAENAYSWMNPNINFTTNRFFNALNNAQEAVEVLDTVTSEALNITETSQELVKSTQELQKAINGDNPKPGITTPDHVPTKTSETQSKTGSNSPEIPPTAERKPET